MDTQNTCPPFDRQTANAIAQRTYRIIQAGRHAGGANNLLSCTISGVLFWEYKPDAAAQPWQHRAANQLRQVLHHIAAKAASTHRAKPDESIKNAPSRVLEAGFGAYH